MEWTILKLYVPIFCDMMLLNRKCLPFTTTWINHQYFWSASSLKCLMFDVVLLVFCICCQCLWIVHYWFPFRFSLMPIINKPQCFWFFLHKMSTWCQLFKNSLVGKKSLILCCFCFCFLFSVKEPQATIQSNLYQEVTHWTKKRWSFFLRQVTS